jgi:Amt family ammonium transporter
MGANFAMMISWFKFGKPDIGMTLNGCLAGLVAITAGCANVTTVGTVLIGSIAGVVVVFAVLFFDKIKIDDPVGAISVHGVCGALGTILVALLHENLFLGKEYDLIGQVTTQLIGVGTAFVWSFGTCFLMFKLIAITIGLRVSAEEEINGLDLFEHGASAYPDFLMTHHSAGSSVTGPPTSTPEMAKGNLQPSEV